MFDEIDNLAHNLASYFDLEWEIFFSINSRVCYLFPTN